MVFTCLRTDVHCHHTPRVCCLSTSCTQFTAQGEQGCTPDAVSYASMIRAYKKGGQWCSALFTFETMIKQDLTVHSAVHSSVIDLLWQTANPWAQGKGRDLFLEASR